MVASALYFGQQRAHHNWYVAGGLALAIAAGIGAVIALIVAILQVPGWAVSLAAFVGVSVWISHLPADVRLVDVPDPVTHAYEIFGAFAIVAVVGAMIGAIRAVRRGVGRFRPVSDPADRRGAGAAWTVGIAMVVSSVLAALAGILYSMTTGGAVTDTGITWTAVAVAIALAGGTSAYGRRGGIFGTVLAAIVFVLVGRYSDLANYRIDPRVLIGSALVIGLLATRLVETYGRPHRAYDEATSRWLGGSASQWPGDDETSRTVATPAAEPERPHADWVDSGGDPWPGR